MLSADQTRLLLYTAADKYRGQATAVILFLLATNRWCRLHDLRWLDTHDVGWVRGDQPRVVLRLPAGPLLLPAVVCEQLAAHLQSYPYGRPVEADDGTVRVPLLRNRHGRRLAESDMYTAVRSVAFATVGLEDVAVLVTPGSVQVVDLESW